MLDLKTDREPTPPKDAATIILVRDGERGVELFCVERSKQSRFMGGAVVFPGGKLDPNDAEPGWEAVTTLPHTPEQASTIPYTTDSRHLRALAVAASRETLEEAAMLHLAGDGSADVTQEDLFALRAQLATDPLALRAFLDARRLRLDLRALHPFARWITPEAEARRYDARFFVAVAPRGQTGAHDEHETMASFWAPPSQILERWETGEVQLAPPTHHTLSLFRECATSADAIAIASRTCLDPICPRLTPQGETAALTLPGDPQHEVREKRASGPSRYVLRGERWVPEEAPPLA